MIANELANGAPVLPRWWMLSRSACSIFVVTVLFALVLVHPCQHHAKISRAATMSESAAVLSPGMESSNSNLAVYDPLSAMFSANAAVLAANAAARAAAKAATDASA